MARPLLRASYLLRWFVRPFWGQEPSFYRAVLVCILAAGVFWQMNALNKIYTTKINCPLVWRYDTARVVALRLLPATIPVTVTGQGWHLLRANLGVGLHPAELRPVSVPGTRYLPPRTWQRTLQAALEDLQVNESAGDTLRVTFDRYATRRLALALGPPEATDSARSYTAVFTPARLTFRGPASVIAQLPDPYLLALPEGRRRNVKALLLPVAAPALVRPSVRQVQARLVALPEAKQREGRSAHSL